MKMEQLLSDDIASFLMLAVRENWVSEEWEFQFLLSAFPQGCFAARTEDGDTVGFVTSICHERSGWIGNLIVAEEQRGGGIGEKLFINALEALKTTGVDTLWLTASQSGSPLYQKYGFVGIDTICRHVGEGRGLNATGEIQPDGNMLTDSEVDIDTRSWGDRRSALLAVTTGRGTLLHDVSGFVSIQPCGDSVQFGPFSAIDPAGAERLFDAALLSVEPGIKVLVDAPDSNLAAARMFNRKRMNIVGSNLLMYAGRKPDYQPELIYGLATMGSCG